MKNYEGLSELEIIRRLKDRNVYLEEQNKRRAETYTKMIHQSNRLFNFMKANNLWPLYHSQNKEEDSGGGFETI